MCQMVKLAVLMVCVGAVIRCSSTAKILMISGAYGMNSHYRDLITMTELLLDTGYDVSVLVNELDVVHMEYLTKRRKVMAMNTKGGDSSSVGGKLEFLLFPYPNGTLRIGDDRMTELLTDQSVTNMLTMAEAIIGSEIEVCHQVFMNQTLIHQMQHAGYDLIITELMDVCGRALVSYLDLPTLGYSCQTVFDHVFFPQMVAILPPEFSPHQYNVTFLERVEGMLGSMVFGFLFGTLAQHRLDNWVAENNIVMKKTPSYAYLDAMVVVDYDFVFGYPRAFMPNIVPIGGWYLQPAKPVHGKIKAFLEEGDYEGLVVVTFGSAITTLDEEPTRFFVKAFERFPKLKFIWKNKNQLNIPLPENIQQYEWLPQNDLLGQPNTRLFITHCGSHSAYETIYHGVPVIAIPLVNDQPKNSQRLVHKLGMGVYVDINELDLDGFTSALHQVLYEPQYRSNARLASRALRDQQTQPKERLLYQVDYSIRHKGRNMYASTTLPHLTTLQMYGVDVAVFLAATAGVVLVVLCGVVFCVARWCCNWCCSKSSGTTDKRDKKIKKQ